MANPGYRRVTFKYMGAYWSLDPWVFDLLAHMIDKNQPFDLYELGARQLKSRPNRLDYYSIIDDSRKET